VVKNAVRDVQFYFVVQRITGVMFHLSTLAIVLVNFIIVMIILL